MVRINPRRITTVRLHPRLHRSLSLDTPTRLWSCRHYLPVVPGTGRTYCIATIQIATSNSSLRLHWQGNTVSRSVIHTLCDVGICTSTWHVVQYAKSLSMPKASGLDRTKNRLFVYIYSATGGYKGSKTTPLIERQMIRGAWCDGMNGQRSLAE